MNVRTFKINGYDIAERLLEDVYFEVKIDMDGDTYDNRPQVFDVQVVPESKTYFSELNEGRWLKEVADSARDTVEEILEAHGKEGLVELLDSPSSDGTLEW